MNNLSQYLLEQLNEAEDAKLKELEKRVEKAEDTAKDAENRAEKAEDKADDAQDTADDAEKTADKAESKGEETIKDEKSFREAARAKFEEVFGDKLDENKMKEVIDGLLNDNKDLVEGGHWGELIGMLNKSFAPGK